MEMLYILFLLGTLSIIAADVPLEVQPSRKRGLIFIPNSEFPNDYKIWVRKGSDLTWYYNYKMYPSPEYVNDTSLQFVPMLWGAPYSFSDTTFLDNVTAQVVDGANITYVLGFNEPDSTTADGGSDIQPMDAAKYWIKQIEPLKKLGISLGAPAVTGSPSGFTWLSEFLDACDGGCNFDFIPIHWYGSYDGMVSHISQVLSTYPDKKIWVTEFALEDSSLSATQQFFISAVSYLDMNQ